MRCFDDFQEPLVLTADRFEFNTTLASGGVLEEADPTSDVVTSPDQSFTGTTSIDDTLAYWDFDLPANTHISLEAGTTRVFDTTDGRTFIRGITIYTEVRQDTLSGFENVIGSRSGDFLDGDDGDNLLVGLGAGPGFTSAGGARPGINDVTRTFAGLESLRQSYNDLNGGAGNDMLLGDLGAFGGAFDHLSGGSGNDTIDGGIGMGDEYYGGPGADAFAFTTPQGTYNVMDWEQGEDVVFVEGATASNVTLTQNGVDLHMTFLSAEIVFHNTTGSELSLTTDVVFA